MSLSSRRAWRRKVKSRTAFPFAQAFKFLLEDKALRVCSSNVSSMKKQISTSKQAPVSPMNTLYSPSPHLLFFMQGMTLHNRLKKDDPGTQNSGHPRTLPFSYPQGSSRLPGSGTNYSSRTPSVSPGRIYLDSPFPLFPRTPCFPNSYLQNNWLRHSRNSGSRLCPPRDETTSKAGDLIRSRNINETTRRNEEQQFPDEANDGRQEARDTGGGAVVLFLRGGVVFRAGELD